jgi:hypothetical protein
VLGDKQTPRQARSVQALRIARFGEELAHGRKSIFDFTRQIYAWLGAVRPPALATDDRSAIGTCHRAADFKTF